LPAFTGITEVYVLSLSFLTLYSNVTAPPLVFVVTTGKTVSPYVILGQVIERVLFALLIIKLLVSADIEL